MCQIAICNAILDMETGVPDTGPKLSQISQFIYTIKRPSRLVIHHRGTTGKYIHTFLSPAIHLLGIAHVFRIRTAGCTATALLDYLLRYCVLRTSPISQHLTTSQCPNVPTPPNPLSRVHRLGSTRFGFKCSLSLTNPKAKQAPTCATASQLLLAVQRSPIAFS